MERIKKKKKNERRKEKERTGNQSGKVEEVGGRKIKKQRIKNSRRKMTYEGKI